MSRSDHSSHLPAPALRAFEFAEKAEWIPGITLGELLGRVNRVLLELLPEEKGRDSRVSRLFHPRSFRRYQTLGGIDAPVRDGKRVLYGFRHFVQALLVRKLLWEQIPAERIVSLVAWRDTEETRKLFLEGMEISVRQGSKHAGSALVGEKVATGVDETWTRHTLAPGIEIHLRQPLPRLRPDEIDKMRGVFETWLRLYR